MNLPKLSICPVCGSSEFSLSKVLWKELISEWQLSEYEADYINFQQGYHCNNCNSNLRSMALATGLLSEYGVKSSLVDAIQCGAFDKYNVLEINEAGQLTEHLRKIYGYTYIQYPEYDMTDLRLDDNKFDIVIHSDTLEHINNPIRALSECWRVLMPEGKCVFTVPTVVDRFTRSRNGLSCSYHGSPDAPDEGMRVYTEFGVDTWSYSLLAGFSSVGVYAIGYPAGMAYVGRK